MASTKPTTVSAYLAQLPADRRRALQTVRKVVLANLPAGFEESALYGMIGYAVPLARYPHTYNGQPLTLAALASQKSHMALYLMSVYGDRETARWFERAYAATGKKLDMGRSCVRFKTLDDLPLDVVGQAIARVDLDTFLARYEATRAGTKGGLAATKASSAAKRRSAAKASRAKTR